MGDKLYIVIVTFNAMPWIDRCLKSCDNYPVIVVDNNSNDNTVNYITDKFPRVHLIKSDKNVGFGVGNNIGIKEALANNARYVFLLNQDAYLLSNALNVLCNFSIKNRNYGILSPIHLDGTEQRLDYNFSKYINQDANPFLYKDAISNTLKKCYEVPFVNAAGWLVTRDCIEKVGFFDPIFFMYGEDDNYIQRAKYFKYKIGVVPSAFMIHDRGERVEKKTVPYSKYHLTKIKTNYLVRWADINNENFKIEFIKEKNKLNKEYLKYLLKLKLRKAKNINLKIKVLKKIYPQIIESRKRNFKPIK